MQLRLAGCSRSQRVFLAWLRLIGVASERLIFRLHIHQSADAAEQSRSGREVVGAPEIQFGTCTIKTHNPRTVRKNVGAEYHGCLLVYVRNSAALNLQIAGWCQGVATAAEVLSAGVAST